MGKTDLHTPRPLSVRRLRTARNSGQSQPDKPKNIERNQGRDQGDKAEPFTSIITLDKAMLARRLGHQESFDVLFRDIQFGGRRALLVALDGFVKDLILLRIAQFVSTMPAAASIAESADQLSKSGVYYIETELAATVEDVVNAVLAGQAAIVVDGFTKALIIDERTYPSRDPDEPKVEKVVRGPRDGFTETIVFNTALVRRRLRDPQLRFEMLSAGRRSRTDIAIGYIKDIADPGLVERIKRQIEAIDTDALPMAEKTIEEFIIPKKRWWNPFPSVRYSERPDVVAAHLIEGHVALFIDTTPSVILLPVTFFHHLQHAQEYHEEPSSGAFLRWIRIAGFLAAWFGPSLWLALVLSKSWLPPGLQFLGPKEPGIVPISWQFVLAELAASLIWVALIHIPEALATSLGLVGALLLGEQAVKLGLFSQETLFYTAVAFIGTFAVPSVDMANAVRVMRWLLIVITAMFGLPGFIVGSAATVALMASTRSFGVPYLYPLWPFRAKELFNVLVRRPMPSRHLRPEFLQAIDPDSRFDPSRS